MSATRKRASSFALETMRPSAPMPPVSQPVAGTGPELQRVLDGLVTGKSMIAPGATAYVAGPHDSLADGGDALGDTLPA